MIILLKKKKKLLIIISIILSISIIAILLLIILKKDKQEEIKENIDAEKLEIDFNDIFDNKGNEYISTLYTIQEEKSGKYKIQANIPLVQTTNEMDIAINKEINDIFIKKLIEIYSGNQIYTKYQMDYAVSINNNILSLVIKCMIKEGNNAQRIIIRTYNYDIENSKEINIMDIVPEEKTNEIQELINKRIKNEIKKEDTIIEQGYNTYRRDEESDIYILENVEEFYLKGNVLYIIYSYGNNYYTSEVDTIITGL